MATKSKDKKTEIIPLYDRVLVSEIETKETKTVSGIFLPDSGSKDKGAKKAKVIAVGEGKIGDDGKRIPLVVKPGDTILFAWGDSMEIEGEEYYIVRESEISAIIK